MPNYIELEKLMAYPIRINHCDLEHGNLHFVLGIESVLEYAQDLPTVDAVEVVRCKDCYVGEHYTNGTVYCIHHGMTKLPDEFCSYGYR